MSCSRILVIDDGCVDRAELAHRVRAAGYRVVGFADDLDEAIANNGSADGYLIALRGGRAVSIARRLTDEFELPAVVLRPATSDDPCSFPGDEAPGYSTISQPFTECQLCTALRHAEDSLRYRQQLRQREAWLEAALTHIHDAAITTDPAMRIVTMNRAAEQLTGWRLTEAKLRPLSEVFRTADGLGLTMPTDGPAAGGAPRVEPMVLVSRDGREHFLDVSAVRVGSPETRQGMLLVFSDVGERFRLADSIQQNRQLEVLARLAGGVAHDFNNLLLIILGYTEELFGYVEPGSPMHEFTSEIRSAAERAVYLTRQLFAFTRRERFAPEVIDLNELLANSQGLLGRLLGEQCRLSFCPCAGQASIKADPAHVEQVVVNLAIRARAASRRPGIFTIRTETGDAVGKLPTGVPSGSYVLLRVHDDGPPLAEDELRCLREPLLATKNASDRSVGLSVVCTAVRQNGGFIEVDCSETGGTSYRVYWPQVVRKSDALAPLAPVAGKDTILLVEDEDVVRALTKLMLTRRGYHVLDAKGGVDALRILDHYAGTVDLLLTDLMMPAMSGVELARCAKSARPSIRVLCMSGYTEESLADLGVAEGEIELIEKPFSSDELAVTVQRILRENGVQALADRPESGSTRP